MDNITDWSAGYVTDLEYIHGYYRELCPTLLRLACLSAGIAPPSEKPLRYLELGFGQGLSVNIHAAAAVGEFWGTDFNPTQAAHAKVLAAASGSEATLFDSSFAELASRTDLPEFDIIALHGIWTWISDENRRVVVDIIRRKLKVGGMAYVSYNCFPGWAPAIPLRHLMTLHAELAGADAAGTMSKVDGALAFARQLADSGALYFRANPAVSERLKRISDQNRNYLAHEYFNRDWDLMTFSDVARWLDDAKLTFVASAHLMDHVEAINLTQEGQKLLSGIQHPVLRQSVRDYFVNQQFRRDIFVKGPCRLTQLEQFEMLQGVPFVLTSRAEDVPRKVTGSLGEASLHEEVYGPILAVMTEGAYAPKTLGTLTAHPKLKAMKFPTVMQALLVLAGAGHAHPAQQQASAVRSRCRALNQYLCNRARSSSDVNFLASPITGGGVQVPRFDQLFILAAQKGGKTEADYASFAWALLSSQGQRLIKDGQTLQSTDDNVAQLTAIAREFTTKRLPILKALEVV